jgi:hypothetical protein
MMIFVAIFFCKPHGIVEYWNTGYGKRKITLSIKNVESTFFDDAHQAANFCFATPNTESEQENQCKKYAL